MNRTTNKTTDRTTTCQTCPHDSGHHDCDVHCDSVPSNPLWLPRGSVRALIAVGVISVWAVLELGVLSEPSDAVRSIAVAVAAGYGFLRTRETQGGGGS